MRETLEDWKRDWIDANGETDDIEVLISEGDNAFTPYIYEGSFKDIPEELLDKKWFIVGKLWTSQFQKELALIHLLYKERMCLYVLQDRGAEKE